MLKKFELKENSLKERIIQDFREIQNSICLQLEEMDGVGKFKEDAWERDGGGGGFSRIMQNGDVVEKGGVNFSAVHGTLPEKIQDALKVDSNDFFATGVSIVIHPKSPMVPIIHMNIRYFELNNGVHWFGGGIDLTPHYIFKEDAAYFHQKLKEVCDEYDKDYYPKFKKWADDYFFIKHRNETRGIGGIFFDRLSSSSDEDFNNKFNFVKAVGNSFAPIYVELANRNRKKKFTETEKNWQLIRRGRYVEFNLVYDKGTKFGLDTSGRIESILMSLPLYVSWPYDFQVKKGSKEEDTVQLLKKNIDWCR